MLEHPIARRSIRVKMRQRRTRLALAAQHQAACAMVKRLCQHPRIQASQTLAVYQATEGEINPQGLLEWAWQHQKQCYLPKVMDSTLIFIVYQQHTCLEHNRWGLLEPIFQAGFQMAPFDLDVVLMPLVAFDREGNRLGRGRGYYDQTFRFLKASPCPLKPYLVGLAYDWQQVDCVTPACWDVPLDAVVTDKRLLDCASFRNRHALPDSGEPLRSH
jgi:5-formyltetrahydrofolate cyclo-ligase